MSPEELGNKLTFLVDAWCERREINPLRKLLNGQASLNGLTDGWEALHHQLRTIRARDKDRLTEGEVDTVVELIHELDRILKR